MIERRSVLKAATLGLGALALPGAARPRLQRGFTHGVASGEPGQDRVLLWTRYVPPRHSAAGLRWEVALDQDFRRIRAGGDAEAGADRDFTAKAWATGLDPGRRYFYRFVDTGGGSSPVGRTATLPQGEVPRFTLGLFSCANLSYGHFNAYAHAAEREDLDLVVHLGDYIYEYARGTYPTAAEAVAGRLTEPAGEAVHLADYRLRHARYRSDPDLQRLHARSPFILMWDDHEIANDAWEGGAENHDPLTEGDWALRKAAAIRAWREWMPVTDEPWAEYRIGSLATLFRLETRTTARSRPLDLETVLRGVGDPAAALVAFRDGPWRDPARTMMGAAQEAWVAQGLARSKREGARWQLLAQQVLMGSIVAPAALAPALAQAPAELRGRVVAAIAAGRLGLPANLDMWDGYPAARERLLRSALDADADLLVLSGDSHNAWAFDLDSGGTAAGVDIGVQSVTSPGYESYLPQIPPPTLASALVAGNRQLRWADTSRRGYASLSLTPERAVSRWHLLRTVRSRDTGLAGEWRMDVAHGARRWTRA